MSGEPSHRLAVEARAHTHTHTHKKEKQHGLFSQARKSKV